MSQSSRSLPLDGTKVLDLSRARSGPTAVRQLADDWGADVLMIEPLASFGRDANLSGPRDGPDFQNLNRNKRSMTLNLKDAEGLVIFRRLVEATDVLVENFRPEVKFRLGIDYETLARSNPRLIYASISGTQVHRIWSRSIRSFRQIPFNKPTQWTDEDLHPATPAQWVRRPLSGCRHVDAELSRSCSRTSLARASLSLGQARVKDSNRARDRVRAGCIGSANTTHWDGDP
jgi:hypothetical protein